MNKKVAFSETNLSVTPKFEQTNGAFTAQFSQNISGGGTKKHEELTGRDLENQHPISAITGLADKLEEIEEAIDSKPSKISAQDVMFENDLVFTEAFGRYKPSGGKVTIPAQDKSWYEILKDAYSEDKNPNTTQPSVGISSSTARAYEVGTKISPAFSGSFNAGAYTYNSNTGVTVQKWSASNNTTSETKTQQSGTFAQYTVADGANYKITISAEYSDGVVPDTALGAKYPAGQIKAGTKTATSGATTGYRNSFYGTLTNKETTLNSATIRALAQKSNKALANGNSFTVDVPVGAMAIVIAYPATLRTLTSIKDVNGMNAEILPAFSESSALVEGANNYSAIKYRVFKQALPSANDTANKYTVTI